MAHAHSFNNRRETYHVSGRSFDGCLKRFAYIFVASRQKFECFKDSSSHVKKGLAHAHFVNIKCETYHTSGRSCDGRLKRFAYIFVASLLKV